MMGRHSGDYIRQVCYTMKVGEYLPIERRTFEEAFPCGWPSIYSNAREAFLSGMIGAGFGTFTCRQDIVTGAYVIGRHEEGARRVYVDPDRAHLFRRTADGYLEPIANAVRERAGNEKVERPAVAELNAFNSSPEVPPERT